MELLKFEEQVAIVKQQAARQSTEYTRIIEQLEKKDDKIVAMQATIDENEKRVKNAEAVLKQSQGAQDEYMRLADKYSELEKKLRNETDKDK